MRKCLIISVCVIAFATACTQLAREKKEIRAVVWITNGDRSLQLSPADTVRFQEGESKFSAIHVDTSTRFQTMDGFGYALTGGSAMLINQKLDSATRNSLLHELFQTENGIGISYLRISIGASDLDATVFSYDDLPTGQTDPTLSKFNLGPDKENLIPILKEVLKINSSIKIMASPWSPPVWMKTNQLAKGGSLKKEYYGAYALYFVKYIRAMAREGILIDAITIQNEPENPNNTPSLVMTASEQAEFIRDHLGPAFQQENLKTKIVVFDHNADHPSYPIEILNDEKAKSFVDGTAFHLYLGEISALTQVHDAHPDKNIYFSEQWTSGEGDFGGDLRWHVKNLIIGASRNWSRTVIEWNLAADPNFEPHTSDGGCALCQGALTIGDSFSRNVSYYIIAHASKFVPPGSVRIQSDMPEDLPNVAFLTPEGKRVVIVLNDSDQSKTFSVAFNNQNAAVTLKGGSVATICW